MVMWWSIQFLKVYHWSEIIKIKLNVPEFSHRILIRIVCACVFIAGALVLLCANDPIFDRSI